MLKHQHSNLIQHNREAQVIFNLFEAYYKNSKLHPKYFIFTWLGSLFPEQNGFYPVLGMNCKKVCRQYASFSSFSSVSCTLKKYTCVCIQLMERLQQVLSQAHCEDHTKMFHKSDVLFLKVFSFVGCV